MFSAYDAGIILPSPGLSLLDYCLSTFLLIDSQYRLYKYRSTSPWFLFYKTLTLLGIGVMWHISCSAYVSQGW